MKNNVLLYLAGMEIVRNMLEQGVLTKKDFEKAEAYLAKKHNIDENSNARLDELKDIHKYKADVEKESQNENSENTGNKIVIKINKI